jgi:hypothetical protein
MERLDPHALDRAVAPKWQPSSLRWQINWHISIPHFDRHDPGKVLSCKGIQMLFRAAKTGWDLNEGCQDPLSLCDGGLFCWRTCQRQYHSDRICVTKMLESSILICLIP